MFPISHGSQKVTGSVYRTLTVPASTNTESAYTEISASLPEDIGGFWFSCGSYSNTDCNALVDIAIGPAGSETVIVSNFPINNYGTGAGFSRGLDFFIPLPAGTRVSFRAQANAGSVGVFCSFVPYPKNIFPPAQFSKAVIYGTDSSASRGTSVDPGTTLNTKGAWTQISSSAIYDIRALAVVFCAGIDATRTSCEWMVDIGVGAAGSEAILLPNLINSVHANHDILWNVYMPFPVSIPAGTRLSARAQCNITTASDRLTDIVLVAFS